MCLLVGCSSVPTGTVVTLAGSTEPGLADGSASAARFNVPSSVVVAPDGTLYVADAQNHAVRRVAVDGTVSTVAGGASPGHIDGNTSDARLFLPISIAFDDAGNLLVGEGGNHDVRRIRLAEGTVETICGGGDGAYIDGSIDEAEFGAITAIVHDAANDVLIVVDSPNHVVRRIDERLATVSTVAGSGRQDHADGAGVSASFDQPVGLASDGAGGFFVSEAAGRTIRHISPDGFVTTVAGSSAGPVFADGAGGAARFSRPWGIAYDDRRGVLFIADAWSHVIRGMSPDGTTWLAAGVPSPDNPLQEGADGPAADATFRSPVGLAVTDRALVVVERDRVRELRW